MGAGARTALVHLRTEAEAEGIMLMQLGLPLLPVLTVTKSVDRHWEIKTPPKV